MIRRHIDALGADASGTSVVVSITQPTQKAMMMPTTMTMAAFLGRLRLSAAVAGTAEAVGIDEPADFLLFTEAELVENGFKVGHARKILANLGGGVGSFDPENGCAEV